MGSPLSTIIDGLHVGPLIATRGIKNLKDIGVNHICSIMSSNISVSNDFVHKIWFIKDSESSDILVLLDEIIDFVHLGRLRGGVLVHCAAGLSRSVSVVIAYIMTLYDLSFIQSYKAIRGIRPNCCPNAGFIIQLINYESSTQKNLIKMKLFEKYGEFPKDRFEQDLIILERYMARQDFYKAYGHYPNESPLEKIQLLPNRCDTEEEEEKRPYITYFNAQNKRTIETVEKAVSGDYSLYLGPRDRDSPSS